MDLYGVLTRGFINDLPVLYRPSQELLDDLAALPENTVVGLQVLTHEDAKSLGKIFVHPQIDSPDFPAMQYWQDIVESNPHLRLIMEPSPTSLAQKRSAAEASSNYC